MADTSVEELTELMVSAFRRQLQAGQEALGEIELNAYGRTVCPLEGDEAALV